MIVEGINDDRSVSVRLGMSGEVTGAATTETWITDHLSDAKSVVYARPSGLVSSEQAVFVNNGGGSAVVNVGCWTVLDSENYLLTEFSVAASGTRVVRVSDLFCGDGGCVIVVTPASAMTNADSCVVTVIEV